MKYDLRTAPHSLAFAIAIAVTPAAQAGDTGTQDTHTTKTGMPYTLHQYSLLADFRVSDVDADGRLSDAEFTTFAERRAAKRFAATRHQREVTGAADAAGIASERTAPPTIEGMPASPHQRDVLKTFGDVDKSDDAFVDFVEVYYYETFERPGLFPPRDESIPQDASGHWETPPAGARPAIDHSLPFSDGALRQAVAAGGFDSVDENADGAVSVFEAYDRSMLYWTQNIYQFDSADLDGNLLLNRDEFQRFQEKTARTMLEAERAGEFPPES